MNSMGIGAAVAAGAVIALALVAPSVSLVEYATTGLFYGVIAAAVAEIVLFALSALRGARR